MDSLAKILYDPVGYYRPWRKAAKRLTPPQRSAFNHYLLGHHALPAYSESAAAQKVLVQRAVSHWDVLPLAAYLVACAKWRSHLVSSRAYLREPPVVRAFLQLGFREANTLFDPGADLTQALLTYGGHHVLKGLQATLPGRLSERLALIFMPIHEERRAIDFDVGETFDATCFWSALTYASSHRELSDSLCG
jgi:type III secretion system OrgA/MxiK family protein